jgi:hypothetical protein
MALAVVHPWAPFFAGLLTGCWIGAAVACAGVLLLVGRRVRQLESINLVLRNRLKARGKPQRTGTGGGGPTLVMPVPKSGGRTESALGRLAGMN